jgi:hypothetical protein
MSFILWARSVGTDNVVVVDHTFAPSSQGPLPTGGVGGDLLGTCGRCATGEWIACMHVDDDRPRGRLRRTLNRVDHGVA